MRPNVMFLAALLAGCGGVEDATPDAAAPEPDAPVSTCTVHDTVQSCGPACQTCPAVPRAAPACSDNACGFTCNQPGPRCSDGSCSRLRFDFESNTLEDIRPKTANLPMAVRNTNGTLALAIDLPSLFNIQFSIPVCLTGDLDVHTRTLRARFLFDGGAPSTLAQYYMTAAQAGGGRIGAGEALPRTWTQYTGQLSMSQQSNTLGEIVFELGTYGAPFAGTIWVDDITLE